MLIKKLTMKNKNNNVRIVMSLMKSLLPFNPYFVKHGSVDGRT